MILQGIGILAEWFVSMNPKTKLSWFKSLLEHFLAVFLWES